MHCLQCFNSKRVLTNHKENYFQVNGIQAVKIPDKDNNIFKFNMYHKQQPVPFVAYGDFKVITEKTSSHISYHMIPQDNLATPETQTWLQACFIQYLSLRTMMGFGTMKFWHILYLEDSRD